MAFRFRKRTTVLKIPDRLLNYSFKFLKQEYRKKLQRYGTRKFELSFKKAESYGKIELVPRSKHIY
jgi:hypothetical protein